MTHRVRVWGPAWGMMALIFALSSISRLPPAPGGLDDSVFHALEYGALGAALVRGLAGARWQGVSAWAACGAVLLATLYGGTDEAHQWFVPGRTAEMADLVADAIGATIAAGLILAWRMMVVAPRDARTRASRGAGV